MLNILIVNYNTQELTDCTIKSVNKHTRDCQIYVFDNSDQGPYVNTFKNVTVIDNTEGQVIDFNEFLGRYPDREKSPGYLKGACPSPRHCYTIDRCMDVIGENFILLDSDVMVKRDLNELVDDSCIFVGDVVLQPLTKNVYRLLPFVCYINVDLCKKYGVRYFDENYMHGINYKKNNPYADRYDTGAGFYYHASKYKHKVIDHRDYVIHFKGGSWDDKATRSAGKYKNKEEFMEKYKQYWKSNKKVIYTCISGPYDRLKDPKVVEEGYDYVCFTDQYFKSDIWSIKPIPEDLMSMPVIKRQRGVKLLPHKYLSEYDFSIWVDSNVEINASIEEYINKNCNQDGKFLWVGEHPVRDCIYAEEKECIAQKKDTKEITNPQMQKYKDEGFPEHFGLPQTCIMFRSHNNPDCVKLDELWWEELCAGSHRDQLSFSYAVWKLGYKDMIQYLDKSIFSCPTFRWLKYHLPIENKQKKSLVLGTNLSKGAPIVKKPNRITERVNQILAERMKKYNPMMD